MQGRMWVSWGCAPSQGLCLLHLLSPKCSRKGGHREPLPGDASAPPPRREALGTTGLLESPGPPLLALLERKRHDHLYDNC